MGSRLVRDEVAGLGTAPDHPQARELATASVMCRKLSGGRLPRVARGSSRDGERAVVHWPVMGVLFVDGKGEPS